MDRRKHAYFKCISFLNLQFFFILKSITLHALHKFQLNTILNLKVTKDVFSVNTFFRFSNQAFKSKSLKNANSFT